MRSSVSLLDQLQATAWLCGLYETCRPILKQIKIERKNLLHGEPKKYTRWQGKTGIIPEPLISASASQETQPLFGLDALENDFQPQALCQGNDCLGEDSRRRQRSEHAPMNERSSLTA